MKRLLAVSWEMPPMYGPRASQVSRTLRQLAEIGWRPTAVCMAPRRGGPHWPNGAPVDPPAGVDLLRVPSPQEWLAVRAACRVFPFLRDFPDTARLWVARATDAVSRAASGDHFAGLITFGQPFSDHLIGLRAQRRTGLPWVAHFSDPWADNAYATARQRAIWRPMEQQVVRQANALVFVAQETVDLVMAKYPDAWRRKAFVVPHGFDRDVGRLEHQGPGPARLPTRDRPMRMVYTGRFYRGMRTPVRLLRALADLNVREPLEGKVEILFIGPGVAEFEPDAVALGIAPVVRFRSRVLPSEAAAAAADADVLLVIDAPSDGASAFLPSKLIDYLPFRKPIFGVTPEEGPSARLLRRLGCPVAPADDVVSIRSTLDRLVAEWRAGRLAVGEAFDRVASEFDIRHTARLLHDVLIRAFEEPRHT